MKTHSRFGVTIAENGVTSVTTNTGLSTNVAATGAVTITNIHNNYYQLLFWGVNKALTTIEDTLTGATGNAYNGTWTADLPAGTITLPATGKYKYSFSTNCKCDATKKVTFYLKRDASDLYIVNSYFDNVSMYNNSHVETYYSGTAGEVIKLNIKNDSGTSNLEDCRINFLVQRIS